MKLKEVCQTITTMLILMTIVILSLWLMLSPKDTFSEIENKVLAKAPVFSLDNLINGSYMEDSEVYITDHFPFRTLFLSVKTKSELWIGKTEKNGVIFAEDGYLIQDYAKINPSDLNTKAEWISSFHKQNPQMDLSVMIIPNSVYVNADKLPEYYLCADQKDVIEDFYTQLSGVTAIDVSEDLRTANRSNQMYYRQDHHWTTQGAYVGYVDYCRANGLTPVELSAYTEMKVSDSFIGTISSKASVFGEPGETIIRYVPKFAQDLTVTYYDSLGAVSLVTDSLYEDSFLQQKDQYASFLNANQPMIVIENHAVENNEKLIIVKDSYANCMIPFLCAHYSEIYVVDLRFFAQPVSQIMQEHEIDHCLLLYNLINFHTDTDLYRLQ